MSFLKPSFFTKFLGSDEYEEGGTPIPFEGRGDERHTRTHIDAREYEQLPTEMGELAVDIYQTQDAIIVKALVAGVQPTTIDISLSREMLTISGAREEEREVDEENYFQRELYWGSFSRTIYLPEEVDVDLAEASEKHGILMIRLPKINKAKQMKLKVRSR